MTDDEKIRFETCRAQLLSSPDAMISAEDQLFLLNICIERAQGARPTEKKTSGRGAPREKVTLQSLLS